MRAAVITGWLIVAVTWLPVIAEAEEDSERSFSVGGLLFGDLYHLFSHHTPEGDGATGVVLRRGYLTFDASFSKRWFGRLRFEANQVGEFGTYDFEIDFKDLYAGADFGRHRVLFGLSPTPTFDLLEDLWGLRYLVRTPLDLQGVASRDTGVSAKGPINASGTVGYRAMVGAGLEFGNETGDGRKWMGAVDWHPSPKWTLDLYADYEQLPGPSDRFTRQGFVGYRGDRLRWSLLYSNQDRQEDPPLELASAFVVRRLAERMSLMARVDRLFEPSPVGDDIAYLPFDPSAPATFFIGGFEYRINRHFRILPNTVVITYDRDAEGGRADTDLYLRLTLFVDFE